MVYLGNVAIVNYSQVVNYEAIISLAKRTL